LAGAWFTLTLLAIVPEASFFGVDLPFFPVLL